MKELCNNDISLTFQMFERETRREKILEARNKELRLKEKTKGILGLGGGLMGQQGGIFLNFIYIFEKNKTLYIRYSPTFVYLIKYKKSSTVIIVCKVFT